MRDFALRTLKMRDCENITNQSCMKISQCIHECLTQLDVSGCTQKVTRAVGSGHQVWERPCHKLLVRHLAVPPGQGRRAVELSAGL